MDELSDAQSDVFVSQFRAISVAGQQPTARCGLRSETGLG